MQAYGLRKGSLSGGLTWLQKTKRVELFDPKELMAVALGAYDDACVIHLGLDLGGQECPRHDVRRVFRLHRRLLPTDSAAELPKYTSINNHSIGLVYERPPALQYCSSERKMVTFDYA